MRRLALVLALALLAEPAFAHRLKVFATVEDGAVTGHAFFVGGGRARGAAWTMAEGDRALGAGRTDAEGRFRFVPAAPVAGDLLITVDAGDGHAAAAVLPAARFGAGGAMAGPPPADTGLAPQPVPEAEALDRVVAAAVQREVAPLLARIEAMDARLRLVDALSGVFLILGLGGMALWAKGRRG